MTRENVCGHPDRPHRSRGMCVACYQTFWKRKNTFGMEVAYEHQYRRTSGRCEICLGYRVSLAVDHDHTTGAFRGLLCKPCNTGLGNFFDSPRLLEKAAAYLREKGVVDTAPEPAIVDEAALAAAVRAPVEE